MDARLSGPMRILSLALRTAATILLLSGAFCHDATKPKVPAQLDPVFSTTSAVAGSALDDSPGVHVLTSDGEPVPGITVTFAVTAGGGSIAKAVATSDAAGLAEAGTWTLGTVAGTNTLTATTAGVDPVTFTVTGTAGPAAKLALVTAPSATVANRAAFGTQPVVQIQDAHSNVVTTSSAAVSASIASGGGTLAGATTVNAVAGVASFTNLSIQGATGSRTLSFSSSGLTPVASGSISVSAGAATVIAVHAGNNQTTAPGAAVAVNPAARVSDADNNPVSGVAVTFTVSAGGGNVTGATATSDASGIATVGSWTLGSGEGTNSLSAAASGLTGSPLTFTATASASAVAVTGVTPATLTPGATATITGQNFAQVGSATTVTIDGVSASVTSLSATSLTVTVPALPCTPAHDATVAVTVGGSTASRPHPVRAGTQRTLAQGASLILSSAEQARCNELAGSGGTYYISVYNTSTSYNTTGASFELKGSVPAAAAIAASPMTQRVSRGSLRAPARPNPFDAERRRDEAHLRHMEREREFLRVYGPRWRASLASMRPVSRRSYAVGDIVSLRIPDRRTNSCSQYVEITGRVAYEGTKAVIVEHNTNALYGTIDSTYAQIGSEYDNVMSPILEAWFGNPLKNDAVLDNNGRIVMVFSNHEVMTGVAGFVAYANFFPRSTCAASNEGEYFYAVAPTVAGDINVVGSPPRWRWSMRGTIIHEVKHIVSGGERFARSGGTVFEESWLEETLARISEEVYERERYGFAQRANIGYGSAANPVGPYCGVRLACNQARGIVRVFEELGPKWYALPGEYSPLGRLNSSDFSFYATGWSLVRWALDASTGPDSSITRSMTQEPTRTGVTNFSQYMGMSFADALPKWTLAMALDDYPGATPGDATIRQPSWNLRDVFSGYKTDFPSASFDPWPLVPYTVSYGNFALTSRALPGTGELIVLSGTQAAAQLIELKADGANAAAPAELRMAIVRIQ